MNPIFLLIVILIPLVGGVLIPFLPFRSRKQFEIYTELVVIMASLLVLILM